MTTRIEDNFQQIKNNIRNKVRNPNRGEADKHQWTLFSSLHKLLWLPAHQCVPDTRRWPLHLRVHLVLPDMALTKTQSQQAILLRIKASKTDQLHICTTAVIGATNAEVCPLAALLDYLNRRSNIPGPLFISNKEAPLRR